MAGLPRASSTFLSVESPSQAQSSRQTEVIELDTDHHCSPQQQVTISRVAPRDLERVVRRIRVGDQYISYSEEDIEWPRTTLSFKHNLDGIMDEWYESLRCKIKGHAIPIRLWSEYLGGIRSKSWETFKNPWGQLKVCS